MCSTANQSVPDCPYVGLQPYSEAEREYFFGREQDTETIAANLLTARLTLLYGASGVGKTSVLAAGVVPYLRAMPNVLVVLFRSWQDETFLTALQTEITRAVIDLGALTDSPEQIGNQQSKIENSSFDEFLAHVAQRTNRTLLIILDQFEEYFLYHPQANPFDEQLARAINRDDVNANFIISIREDALSQLDRFETRIPNLMSNYLRLDHLNRDGAVRAICKPLDVYNAKRSDTQRITIEDALVDTLIDQMQTGRVALSQAGQGDVSTAASASTDARIETPFLQMVLTRLWDEERGSEGQIAALHLSTLQRLGGAEKIVRTHLDTLMSKLGTREQAICSTFFDRLVTPSGTKIAQNADDLVTYAARPAAQVTPVLKKLADARVLRPIAPPLDRPQIARYEIFHDVLAPAILDWRRRYVERQRTRRLRWMALGAGLVILVFAILTIFAIGASIRATIAEGDALQQRDVAAAQADARATAQLQQAQARSTAEALSQVASSRELAAYAMSQLPTTPDLGLTLAVEAASVANTAQAEDALRAALAQSNVRAVMCGHTDELTSASFSPSGKFVVTASKDKTARVWNAATGASIAELKGHTGEVTSAAFSPLNDNLVVTASRDKTARLWDATTGRELFTLSGHTGDVTSAAFSPDGKMIVTASEDKAARVWDTITGKSIAQLIGHQSGIRTAVFSPDGKIIVTTATLDKVAQVWDASTGRNIGTLRGHTDAVLSAVFSPRGDLVVTASADNTAMVWNVATRKSIYVLRGHTGPVTGIAVHNYDIYYSDTFYIVTAGGNSIRVWYWGGDFGKTLPGTLAATTATSVAFSRNANQSLFVTAGSLDNIERVWRMNGTQPEQLSELRGHSKSVVSAAFSPNGKFVVTASKDATARVWEAIGQNIKELPVSFGDLLALARTRVTRELTCEERARYLHEPPCPTPSPAPIPTRTPTPGR